MDGGGPFIEWDTVQLRIASLFTLLGKDSVVERRVPSTLRWLLSLAHLLECDGGEETYPLRSSLGAPMNTPIKQITVKNSVDTVMPIAPDVSGIASWIL